jgi:phosphoribosylformylglycinamidine synthase subunit PurQ / glutaminase
VKVAVLRFPGSNCDQDALHALRDDLGIQADYVWHTETSLSGFEGVFVPGGFSYGDYLRCGAMAARSPIMDEVRKLADRGNPVFGACNGFQILCESGLLEGALLQNANEKFLCQDVFLKPSSTLSPFTKGVNDLIRIPIAHGEGRYICEPDTLKVMQDSDQIAFRYCNSLGDITSESNPNGSTDSIAGVLNKRGNVLGMMPHPERACRPILGSSDGQAILRGFSLVLS